MRGLGGERVGVGEDDGGGDGRQVVREEVARAGATLAVERGVARARELGTLPGSGQGNKFLMRKREVIPKTVQSPVTSATC